MSSDGELDPIQQRARDERKFYEQAFGSVGIVLVLFVINLATGGGWWFYWPAIGLGVITILHAVKLFSPANRFDDAWEQRRAEQLRAQQNGSRPAPTVATDPKSAEARSQIALWRSEAASIANPEVRAQVDSICDQASRVLDVLSEPGRDAALSREFFDQVVGPATTVISGYARLSQRNVAGAGPALARVETHDLPIIQRTLTDLYTRLHRSDIVSLEVASEMLDLGSPYVEAN